MLSIVQRSPLLFHPPGTKLLFSKRLPSFIAIPKLILTFHNPSFTVLKTLWFYYQFNSRINSDPPAKAVGPITHQHPSLTGSILMSPLISVLFAGGLYC